MQLRSAVLHKLYSEHIFRKLIQKMHTHRSTKERKFWELSGKKMERRQTNSSTAYLRVRERCAYSTLSLPQHEKKKREIFVNWKKTFWTNKLEYCVLESERTLRVLHLMFAHADSPDRMSNSAQGSQLEDDEHSSWKLSQVRRTAPPQPRIRTQCRIYSRHVASDYAACPRCSSGGRGFSYTFGA